MGSLAELGLIDQPANVVAQGAESTLDPDSEQAQLQAELARIKAQIGSTDTAVTDVVVNSQPTSSVVSIPAEGVRTTTVSANTSPSG